VHAPLFERRRRRAARVKANGDTAAELMTTPAITVGPDVTVVQAARLMDAERVKRLPVVGDQCRLLGIVARSDLLRIYLRPDEAIQEDVTDEVLAVGCGIEPSTVEAYVVDGIVTLRGRVERRSNAQAAVKLTRVVTGVVDVVDELSYEYDDTAALTEPHVFGPQI
jgi:CBS-domain-containing membrane protein